jgi:hypothetical protein
MNVWAMEQWMESRPADQLPVPTADSDAAPQPAPEPATEM